jgi:hypothetical protein
MGFLQRRHELGDWAFPVLTETELQARRQILQVLKAKCCACSKIEQSPYFSFYLLQQFIDQVAVDAKQKELEEHGPSSNEQVPESDSQDSGSISDPHETGDVMSEASLDARALNLPE